MDGADQVTADGLDPDQELEQIVASARRLGVELDEAGARQWLRRLAG